MLTREDKEWIGQAIAASEDRIHNRIKDGALSDLRKDVEKGFKTVQDELGSLGEALGRVKEQVGEISVMNENLQALREHAGI